MMALDLVTKLGLAMAYKSVREPATATVLQMEFGSEKVSVWYSDREWKGISLSWVQVKGRSIEY